MYELPGSASGEAEGPPTLVDLLDDDDLECMWEEMAAMQVRETEAGAGTVGSGTECAARAPGRAQVATCAPYGAVEKGAL